MPFPITSLYSAVAILLSGTDIVAGDFGGVRTEMLYAMSPRSNTAALRVGDWKIIEGVMGRGDCECLSQRWRAPTNHDCCGCLCYLCGCADYGEDTTAAWTAVGPSYLVGEHMDWDAVASMPDGKVGDGGQMELSKGLIQPSRLKRLWLFNLRVRTDSSLCLACRRLLGWDPTRSVDLTSCS
eukprot:COSAG06_NODE_16982_length_969_cov_1.008046_2_plen_182_part_00